MKRENSDTLNSDQFLLDHPNALISLDKWQKTIDLLAQIYKAPASFLVQYTGKGFQTTIASQQASASYPPGGTVGPDTDIFCRRVIETNDLLYVADALSDPEWKDGLEAKQGTRSYLGVPINWPNGKPFGTFCVKDSKATDYDPLYLALIQQLKELLESDLRLVESYQELQRLAVTDPLTRVNNRRGFYALAKQRINLAKRTDKKLALYYFDIDKFKAINDQHGHAAGDSVLQHVAQLLSDEVRDYDVVGRLGGDEFAVLLTMNSQDDISNFEKRLEAHISAPTGSVCQFRFTLSYDSIEVNFDQQLEQMLIDADKGMMAKKGLRFCQS